MPSPHELQWLAAAPQFHAPDANAHHFSYSSAPIEDDGSDDASGSETDGEDPFHPYNIPDRSRWVQKGGFVYATNDLPYDPLAPPRQHVVDDQPYLPPPVHAAVGSGFSQFYAHPHPREIQIGNPSFQGYVFAPSAPRPQQMISPLDVSARPPPPPPVALPTSASRTVSARRTSARQPRTYIDLPSEDEANSSGDDASEDEYVPSPPQRHRKLPSARANAASRTKRARYSYSPYPSSAAPSPSSHSESSTASGSRRTGSRNVQIFNEEPPPRGSWSKEGPDAYRCPYCDHYQQNKRSPDMERHIRSHFRSKMPGQWVCCGVPVEDAHKYHVKAQNAKPWVYNGQKMVGGCHRDFSRMDALKRHWANGQNPCVGDVKYL